MCTHLPDILSQSKQDRALKIMGYQQQRKEEERKVNVRDAQIARENSGTKPEKK